MSNAALRPETWSDPRQEARPSPIHGLGIFARAPIAAGEPVEIIGGTLLTEAEFRAFQAVTPWYSAVQIGEDLHLVERPAAAARRRGSLNHSCDGNLWLVDAVTLVARRPIVAGEELTVDYALFSAQADWALEQRCACGSPLCRGAVTGADWRRPELQQRYAGHFSPFLNARIAALAAVRSGAE